jgi:hypothetical protein
LVRRRRSPVHAGLKGTHGYDKTSGAIEFANELALELDGDRVYAFGAITPNTVYTGPFLALDWRGHKFFAQLDEAQVNAGIELTLDICRRHDIDPVFYYPSTTYDYPRCFQVATIICHSNCRGQNGPLPAGMGLQKDPGGGDPVAIVMVLLGDRRGAAVAFACGITVVPSDSHPSIQRGAQHYGSAAGPKSGRDSFTG